jgi:hypothetical protein
MKLAFSCSMPGERMERREAMAAPVPGTSETFAEVSQNQASCSEPAERNAVPIRWSPVQRSIVAVLAAFVIAVCPLASGCRGFTEPIEDSKNTENAIKSELGVDATVTFRINAGMSGKRTVVTVRLKTAPAGDAASIKSKVDDIVNHTFRSHVERVDVSL